MKISLNSIRLFNKLYKTAGDPAPNGVDDLVTKIGAQLGAVEEIANYGERFKGVIIARVVSCEDHPNADRLHVCKIDDGGKVKKVERDENGHVQVVCGAPNVREGLMVAWLPPGSAVPNTFGTDEPFVLEARALRGVVSNGMLASPHELSIGDNHDGILEVDIDVGPGTTFTEGYDLDDDAVIDIENKMFTHRPDCFGQLGVARELEGIQHRSYKSPKWYTINPDFPELEADALKLEVKNELPAEVPRFTAITMNNVQIEPSPVWVQIYLTKSGVRPINNIVDFTNFLMLETGQPLHAYDYDKVVAQDRGAKHATIVIRNPKKGEKITLLNGKEIEPRAEAIMIATKDKLIGVAGVMGGTETEVDQNTKRIILECANFDMYSIRKTSMTHGLFTDAVTRFNKGQSPLQNLAILAKLVDEIRFHAVGKVAGKVIDDNHLPKVVMERGSLFTPVKLSRWYINSRLGFNLSSEEIAKLLENVEFNVKVDVDELTVSAPFWRTDIEIPEDVVEEVGRLYGFDHLPLVLPKRDITPAPQDALLTLKQKLRNVLSYAGANELLTYSFVHGNLLDKVGQKKEQAFRIGNALSPELQYYRMSLTPSLLDKVHPNIKSGYDHFALFEVNKVHPFGNSEYDNDGLPRETDNIGFVFASNKKTSDDSEGAPYYQARKYLDELLNNFGVSGLVSYVRLDKADFYGNTGMIQIAQPFEPKRSAALVDGKGLIWGVVGEFKKAIHKNLKLSAYCSGFDVDLLLFTQSPDSSKYKTLSRFPRVEQDICLRVPATMEYQKVYDFINNHLDKKRPDETQHSLTPIDIYKPKGTEDFKQITWRLSIVSYARTLTDQEVNALLDAVAAAAKDQFHATRI